MPRKKTVQPDPEQVFTLDDGTVVEVRGEGSWEIGRGHHKKNKYDEWRDEVLDWVVDHYLTPQGRKDVTEENDFLQSASKFDQALQDTDFYPFSGDDSAVRKRLYPDIVRKLRILTNLVEEQNRNPK